MIIKSTTTLRMYSYFHLLRPQKRFLSKYYYNTIIKNFIKEIKWLGISSIILKSDCIIDRNYLTEAVSVCNHELKVESFSKVLSGENAVSLLLTGISYVNCSSCDKIANDLSIKINGVCCEDGQLLDKSIPEEYN